MEPARLEPEALRLLVGRWRLLQRPAHEERTCVLVLIGATEDGTKELLGVVDGYRESAQSWRELLQQLKRLGLSISSYQTKFPKACECLEKDKDVLFTFYDFPTQHWSHLRT